MGYRPAAITVSARLSSHNDERDDQHAALWEEFRRRVQQVAGDPAFADLDLSVDAT